MSDAAVQLADLTVRAGRSVVLDVPRLHLEAGGFLGLLGPNGAGKSTLLRCLLGTQTHVGGRVSVLGREVGRLGARGLADLRRLIGYVPQLLPGSSEMPLTVREVVAIGRTALAGLLRPLRRADWRAVDAWIDRLGLGDLAGRGFAEISGGQQRKVLLARAMSREPRLLLLDEPTANLDLGWRERIVEAVGELYAAEDLTVVLVCHELEVLPPCCRRVTVLKDGRVLADAPPAEALSAERIEALYGPGLSVHAAGGRLAVVPAAGGGPAHA